MPRRIDNKENYGRSSYNTSPRPHSISSTLITKSENKDKGSAARQDNDGKMGDTVPLTKIEVADSVRQQLNERTSFVKFKIVIL